MLFRGMKIVVLSTRYQIGRCRTSLARSQRSSLATRDSAHILLYSGTRAAFGSLDVSPSYALSPLRNCIIKITRGLQVFVPIHCAKSRLAYITDEVAT